jgi:hypothetical protein
VQEDEMTSSPRILIEVELGKKAVEKTDIFVYHKGQLVESHFDVSYDDLRPIAENAGKRYEETDIEAWCVGEDCMGGLHRWQVDV